MKNDFDPNLPIYIQVMDEIRKEIFTGKYAPGDKVSSVRELALNYGVNPNTIQKALSELEREGILFSKRALGRFVTDNLDLVSNLKKEVPISKIRVFLQEMAELGYDREKVIEMINEVG